MKNAFVERMLYVLLLLTFVGAGVSMYLAADAVSTLKKQQVLFAEQQQELKSQGDAIESILKGQSGTVSSIQDSLLCILTFFGLEDREELVISDLNNCTVTDTTSGESRSLPLPPVPQQQEQNRTPAGQQQQDDNQQPGNGQGNGNGNNDNNPPPAEQHPPREVLGVPVCWPFTNACIRR